MPWIIRDGQPVKVGPEVDTRITTPEVPIVTQVVEGSDISGLTPKQRLQYEAGLLGVEFTDRTTIPELERLIALLANEEE